MAVIVIDQAELGIIELAGPLDGLLDTASRRTVGALAWQAIGGIDITAADVAGGAVYLTDILRQIPAVGVPGAVLLDGQRAGGDVLRGMIAAGEGGDNTSRVLLRERKAIHRHGFCCDVAGGQGVVGLTLRSNMLLYPLRRSQVSFVNC